MTARLAVNICAGVGIGAFFAGACLLCTWLVRTLRDDLGEDS